MTLPKTYRHYARTDSSIKLAQGTLPASLGENEVLVHIKAVSLNYRDVAILNGNYPPHALDATVKGGIPCSDAAGEVVAVGSGVTTWKVGDRVTPPFNLNAITGEEPFFHKMKRDLGGDVNGVLAEYGIFDENILVKVPSQLSYEEAATIPCAGMTAWTALGLPGNLNTGKTVLLQGTGGVSMFGLVLCLAGGLQPIITSSSDAKLDAIKALAPGAIETINYKTYPEWSSEVMRITNGVGADIILENGGPATINESIQAVKPEGLVSMVGFLQGIGAAEKSSVASALFWKMATLRAVKVGTKNSNVELSQFLEDNKINLKSIIDQKRFAFVDAPAAFKYLESGRHTGKVVISIP